MAVKLHPSIDKGLKAGAKKFKGGTLTCHCAADPVTVSIKGNVAHNHACGCTKCWKPAGAKFSVVAVVSRDNLSVTANEHPVVPVSPSTTVKGSIPKTWLMLTVGSLSTMVPTARPSTKIAPLPPKSTTWKDSVGSPNLSPRIGTLNVWLVAPGANVIVPSVCV